MPDTAANQKAYPQLSGRKPGVGFPIMVHSGSDGPCAAAGLSRAIPGGPYHTSGCSTLPFIGFGGAYHARWHIELDMRSIKQVMAMDVLRCKTPEMVRTHPDATDN